jgi:multiple sugar transport system permease protein
MLTPVIFFTLTMGIIGSFQIFTQAYVMSGAGVDNSTLFYVLYLFNQAFRYFHMGYGAAMAWLLFAIVLVVTILQFRLARRWVFYAGGEQ